jgi:hypothetical protein
MSIDFTVLHSIQYIKYFYVSIYIYIREYLEYILYVYYIYINIYIYKNINIYERVSGVYMYRCLKYLHASWLLPCFLLLTHLVSVTIYIVYIVYICLSISSTLANYKKPTYLKVETLIANFLLIHLHLRKDLRM